MKYRMLCVEDDSQIREIIEDYFTSKTDNDFEVFSAENGIVAEKMLSENEYDLMIRRKSDVPVIFLTARTLEEDVLLGFETGCDDYITKPFSLAKLYAKCIALLNRAKGTVIDETITIGRIRINPNSMEVTVNGTKVDLANKEFELLKYLADHKNWVVSRDSILNAIWGYEYEGGDRVVDNHIKKLRKSLGSAGEQIKTVISKGYKLSE